MKKIYTLLLLSAGIIPAIAQPTLTSSMNFQPGDMFSFTNMDTVGVTPGASGANVTWNFASLTSGSTGSLIYVDAATTPNASTFPNADVAAVDASSTYQYYSTGSILADEGIYGGTTYITYSDPANFLVFPVSYNDTYTDNFSGSGSLGGNPVTRTGTTTTTADAHGTLILPFGTYNNVIRLKTVQSNTTVTSFGNIIQDITYYQWYDGTYKFPILQIMYSTSTFMGTTTPANSVLTSTPTTGIKEATNERSFAMYPNPATSSITINNGNDVIESVSILSLNGSVALEIKGGNSVISTDISSLAKGMYQVRVVDASGVRFQKLLVK